MTNTSLFDAAMETPRTPEEDAALDAAAAAEAARLAQREAGRLAAAGYTKGDRVRLADDCRTYSLLAIDEAFEADNGDPIAHLHCDEEGSRGFYEARLSQVRRA